MNGARIAFLIIGIVSALAIIAGLIGGAFSVLEPTEFGIAIDGTAVRIDTSRIYTAGRYALGLGWYFVKYPQTVIAETFDADTRNAIVARSKDGVVINLDCSFEYRLLRDQLIQLHFKFGSDYRLPISKTARETIRSVASEFEAFGFFLNRSIISNRMAEQMRVDLAVNHVSLNSFQLLDIQLPAAFASAIQTTEITRQQIATATFQQERARVEAQTQVLAATQQAQVIEARAAADAQVITAQARAQANSINERTSNLIAAYSFVKSNYTMTSDELLNYIWLQALGETAATLTYSYKKPAGIQF